MRSTARRHAPVWAVAAAALVVAGPAFGAAFSIFEQGTKAMGMAGAFTAQADDPSAMFHNAAGLAFQKERDIAVGLTYIRSLEADLVGLDPFPGAGYTAEQETLSEFPPHAYWVQPISSNWTFGLGVNAPFGLTTEWAEDFRGRFVSRLASLQAVDLNPTLAWQVTPNFGIGFGGIARFSSVELERHVPQFNPFTQTIADVATLKLDGSLDNEGFGWNAGLLHKATSRFTWGLSYRSGVDIDYEGDARLTQNLTGTPFDQVIGGALPFDVEFPVETAIDFPDTASLGLAYVVTPAVLVEFDANWTGWSSFEELPIVFPEGQLPSQLVPQRYDDSNHYRLGVRIGQPASQWRAGVVFDETPQPEEAVSPLLPDSDRLGVTLGYGHEGRVDFDLAVMYLTFDERTRDQSFADEPASTFFGTYNQEAVLVGLTLGF
ncbi:MAG TPA: outer membrane protein transport protein [Thermoanaerobaculia bacterium]